MLVLCHYKHFFPIASIIKRIREILINTCVQEWAKRELLSDVGRKLLFKRNGSLEGQLKLGRQQTYIPPKVIEKGMPHCRLSR